MPSKRSMAALLLLAGLVAGSLCSGCALVLTARLCSAAHKQHVPCRCYGAVSRAAEHAPRAWRPHHGHLLPRPPHQAVPSRRYRESLSRQKRIDVAWFPRLCAGANLLLPHPLQITAVISAHNDNTKSYNLTAVVASLNSPLDFSMYIQNFTHRVWSSTLAGGLQNQQQHVGGGSLE